MKTFDEWWDEYNDPRDVDLYGHQMIANDAWNAAVITTQNAVKDPAFIKRVTEQFIADVTPGLQDVIDKTVAAERERCMKIAKIISGYDADFHQDGSGELTGAVVVEADVWGELKDWAAGVLKK